MFVELIKEVSKVRVSKGSVPSVPVKKAPRLWNTIRSPRATFFWNFAWWHAVHVSSIPPSCRTRAGILSFRKRFVNYYYWNIIKLVKNSVILQNEKHQQLTSRFGARLPIVNRHCARSRWGFPTPALPTAALSGAAAAESVCASSTVAFIDSPYSWKKKHRKLSKSVSK